jgi:hypothetical protein
MSASPGRNAWSRHRRISLAVHARHKVKVAAHVVRAGGNREDDAVAGDWPASWSQPAGDWFATGVHGTPIVAR